MEDDFSQMNNIKDKVFFKKYHCISKLGKGTFGSVFKAEYDKKYYALKFESLKKGHNLLENEAEIMDYLQGTNIPYVELFSSTNEYNILVMELLGKSLDSQFKKLQRFSLKTVCMLGDQILSILEYIHDHHIVHRDIKPDNFCMGLDYNSKYVYLVDFGLAKKYRSCATLIHYPLINKRRLTGTPRYASINALKGFEQSRRDDLESLSYVLIYFLRGELPWQHINAKTKDERNQKILEKKMELSSSTLCEGFPIEFEKFLDYTRNLEYSAKPNYDMLRNLIMTVMDKNNLKYNYVYDWTTKEEIKFRANEDYWRKEEEELDKKEVYSTRNIYNINNYKDNKYNRKYGIKKMFNNYHKVTNAFPSNDFLPIIKVNDKYKKNEESLYCSSVCNIF